MTPIDTVQPQMITRHKTRQLFDWTITRHTDDHHVRQCLTLVHLHFNLDKRDEDMERFFLFRCRSVLLIRRDDER